MNDDLAEIIGRLARIEDKLDNRVTTVSCSETRAKCREEIKASVAATNTRTSVISALAGAGVVVIGWLISIFK